MVITKSWPAKVGYLSVLWSFTFICSPLPITSYNAVTIDDKYRYPQVGEPKPHAISLLIPGTRLAKVENTKLENPVYYQGQDSPDTKDNPARCLRPAVLLRMRSLKTSPLPCQIAVELIHWVGSEESCTGGLTSRCSAAQKKATKVQA